MEGHAHLDETQEKIEPLVINTNSLRGMNRARHAKRIVPEALKDETYWEKRKKNNIAAKRSRESKRRLESDIRIKTDILEKENALLKKEVSLLKAKYGIPDGHSIMTHQEQLDCLKEFDETHTSSGKAEKFRESGLQGKSRLDVTIMSNNDSQGTNISRQSSDHRDEKSSPVCSEYEHPTVTVNNSFDGIVWSTGAEQQIHMEQTGNGRWFTIESLNQLQNLRPCGQNGHFPYHCLSYQRSHEGHEQGFLLGADRQQAHISANLSMAKPGDIRNTSVHIPSLQSCPKSPSCESASSHRNGTEELNKYELRRKIMQLSAQCEEMKDFVFKT